LFSDVAEKTLTFHKVV